MQLRIIKGIIDRRILINYTIDSTVLEKYLPNPFRPKLIEGRGVAGICLIRLKGIRPKGFPEQIGISSENGAHRIAVEWEEDGELKEGVYIPRRDTSSRINSLVGGRIFPGKHHFAKFEINENEGHYHVAFKSDDKTTLSIKARETTKWNQNSMFKNLEHVSAFFEQGSVGYSATKNNDNFDGLKLEVYNWKVSLLNVTEVQSSFFNDESIFPNGSVVFDNALLMKNIEHEWVSLRQLIHIKKPT